MSLDLNFARLITAFERIADALETNIARGALPVGDAPKVASKKSTPAKQDTVAATDTSPSEATDAVQETSSTSTTATTAASPSDVPTDRESVKAAAMSLASGPAGPAILKELFIEAGSAEGKFNSIPDSGLAGLAVRIAELKAA